MYVIYPADELLRIYENPIRQSLLTSTSGFLCRSTTSRNGIVEVDKNKKTTASAAVANYKNVNNKNCADKIENERKLKKGNNNNNNSNVVKNGNKRSHIRDRNTNKVIMQNIRNLNFEEGSNPLKDLTHASSNEPLKQHNGNAVKLVQIGKSNVLIHNILIFCMLSILSPLFFLFKVI